MLNKQEYLFQKALQIYSDALLKNLPQEAEYTEIAFSERHHRRMRRLFKKSGRFYYPLIRTRRRCAALAATLTILLALPIGVSAAHIDFTQFAIKIYTLYTDLFFPKSDSAAPFVPVEPTYLPKGFSEFYRETDENSNYIIYQHKDGTQIIYQQLSTAGLGAGVNTENAQIEKLILSDNTEVLYVCHPEFSFFSFYKNGCYYEINALLPKQELIKIAESVLTK